MNTFSKFLPNVWLAKCTEKHSRDQVILVTNKYGQEKEHVVYNEIFQKDGFYYYSIVRADGFNSQQRAKNRAEKLAKYSANAEKRGNQWYEKSQEGRDFLSLGEPIKAGHHSEKSHRALIERNANRMNNAMAEYKKSESYESRIRYWESLSNKIDLSMPESVDYFEAKLEQAKATHEGLKNGTIKKQHSYSLTYAKKEVNDLEKKLKIAKQLWD